MARPNSNLFGHQLNPAQIHDAELPRVDQQAPRHKAIGLAGDAPHDKLRANDVPIVAVADHQIEKPQHARPNNKEEDQVRLC